MDPFINSTLLDYLSNLSQTDKLIIQNASYLHTNGFYKIILKRYDDGSCLRLHYWLKDYNTDQNPHNHGWNFYSKILVGSLQNTNYIMTTQNILWILQDTTKHRILNHRHHYVLWRLFPMLCITKMIFII